MLTGRKHPDDGVGRVIRIAERARRHIPPPSFFTSTLSALSVKQANDKVTGYREAD
jgi:hypothetical protein